MDSLDRWRESPPLSTLEDKSPKRNKYRNSHHTFCRGLMTLLILIKLITRYQTRSSHGYNQSAVLFPRWHVHQSNP